MNSFGLEAHDLPKDYNIGKCLGFENCSVSSHYVTLNKRKKVYYTNWRGKFIAVFYCVQFIVIYYCHGAGNGTREDCFVCLLLFYAIATVFQLYHGGDMI